MPFNDVTSKHVLYYGDCPRILSVNNFQPNQKPRNNNMTSVEQDRANEPVPDCVDTASESSQEITMPKVTVEHRDTVWSDLKDISETLAKAIVSGANLIVPQCQHISSVGLKTDKTLSGALSTHKSENLLMNHHVPNILDVEDVRPKSTEEDEEGLQMRRLGSWETNGTFGTIDTVATAFIDGTLYDDDGYAVDARFVDKRLKRMHRKRLVKFAYPPVSSLRQCPRATDEEIKELYFSEKELDEFEDDRISTFVADDVEIVAIASSLSEAVSASSAKSSSSAVENTQSTERFPNHSCTSPRPQSTDSTKHRRPPTPFRRRKQQPTFEPPAVPEPATDEVESTVDTVPEKSHNKRLIKSVQIYLRERSVASPRSKKR